MFERSLNATFLVLIPNNGWVEDLKGFRPLSLVNRLKKVMRTIVSYSKNAFVEGR